MWTLTPDLREWRNDGDIRLVDLWEQEYKRARLPACLPMNPILSKQEDSILYMTLPDYYKDDKGLRSSEVQLQNS
ncbi:hypothetical protein E2562_005912 [Oryza meyeriana var. granulata]|uniref:Uncharacterized protein n=1 Tax=Oryza meyeriana var. granulata TaxID=110450 RepID=A0A6G1DV01_9ORYZ|nr:hypothetical protein E2562_005912 [Oryza meyeriana var. granulata]